MSNLKAESQAEMIDWDEVGEAVRLSRQAQGLPATITCPVTLKKMAALAKP